ncbi:PAS domain S-box protein [Anaerosphaera multitolerans]|uniref:PAS domain S-box protein n=2 Tax=Anaerosphaera multitolerans TaxID=2487351 RepID=A0A437S5M1_9FIRM|nr:PAS domain S-box protein [Anaerosphaera multitolerans]
MTKEELIEYIEKEQNREIKSLYKLIEKISEGIYITDGNANTIFVNEAYEYISGTNRDLFLGKNMHEVVKEGLIDKSATLDVIKYKKEITMNQVLNNGKSVLITGTPIYNENKKIDKVVTIVRDITTLNQLQEEVLEKQKRINKLKYIVGEENDLVYRSRIMEKIAQRAKKVSVYDTTVLLTGETGVGKDVIAKLIHKVGNRKDKPFVEINCSAIPRTLMESELFGYEPGSFTGASKHGKKGVFELANQGTIFLDEISEMSIDLQAKLLKVIQDKKIVRIGGEKSIDIDVKIITATNRNLEERIKEGKFREDLYYRLNVIPIYIPPLRERKEDIIVLLDYFLEEMKGMYGEEKRFSEEAMKILYDYNWPGNVRELRNLVERLYILTMNDIIDKDDLPDNILNIENIDCISKYGGYTLKNAVENLEKSLIENAIKNTNTLKDAAKYLGMDPSTFTRKKQKYFRN